MPFRRTVLRLLRLLVAPLAAILLFLHLFAGSPAPAPPLASPAAPLAPSSAAPRRLPLPAAPPSTLPVPAAPSNAQLVRAALGRRPLPSPTALPSFLPPHYCTVQGCQQREGCAVAEGYLRLLPSEVAIAAEGGCHWAKVRSLVDVHMCTHNPAVDTQVSYYLHERGSWIAVEELAAFLQVACSPERPFMLDVGSNIGSYSVPAAALGCSVVSFDPSRENLGRVLESMRRMGALQRATLYQNFVGGVHSHRLVRSNTGNMGGTTFERTDQPLDAETVSAGNASFVVLDDFFSLPSRPLSPLTGQPVQPSEVGFMKIDAEGCDMEILYSAQRLLQEGRVPFITIEFAESANCQAECAGGAFLDHMYSLGYSFFEPYRADAHAVPRGSVPGGNLEWWFAHKNAALPLGWQGAQEGA